MIEWILILLAIAALATTGQSAAAGHPNLVFMIADDCTYLDMEIEEGAAGTDGNTLSATPNHTASLWGFWEPQTGPLEGFGFGGGLRYVGESWGDDTNTFENDAYVFTDLAMSYDFGQQGFDGVQLQVNVKNVFDETGQTCSAGYCYRYEGRTATASVRYRF